MGGKLRGMCPLCGHEGQLTLNGRMRTHKPKLKNAPVGPSGNCDGGSGEPLEGSVRPVGEEAPARPLTAVEQRVADGLPPNPHRDPVPTDGRATMGPERTEAERMDRISELTAEVVESLKNRTPEQKLATAARMDRTECRAAGLPLDIGLQIQAHLAGVLTDADRADVLELAGYDLTCIRCDQHGHVCPGCGDRVNHTRHVCAKCQMDYAEPATDPGYDVDLELLQEGLLPESEAATFFPSPLSDVEQEAAAFLAGETPDVADDGTAEAEEFLAGGGAVKREGPGNYFTSRYDGDCDNCGSAFFEGEEIRADGQGGWQAMGCCGWKEDMPSEEEIRAAEAVKENPDVTADEWDEAERVLAARDWYGARATDASSRPKRTRPKVPLKGGRYVMPHPDKPGKLFRGTRVTTFVKLPEDHKALEDWQLRNVVKGVGLRPELGLKAKELDVKADRDYLNRLAQEAKAAADAQKRANLGTILHKHTEELDRGTRALEDMPPEHLADLTAYADALAEYGYRMFPDLVERTVGLVELGVMGTLDRVTLCPDGKYRIGDVKSGDLTYAKSEIETQLGIYAKSFNAHGVAEWTGEGDPNDPTTWTWVRPVGPDGQPIYVEEDYGVVFHLPQGKGYCVIYPDVDLESGWATAQLAAFVRDHQRDAKKITWTPADPPSLREPEEEEPELSEVIPVPPAAQETRKHPLTREQRDALAAADIAAQAGRFPAAQVAMDRVDQEQAAIRDAVAQMEQQFPQQPLKTQVAPEPMPAAPPTWEERWNAVTTKAEASALWQEMHPFKADIGDAEFSRLVAIGTARISSSV